jgi:arylsulfatase A-like enzyme
MKNILLILADCARSEKTIVELPGASPYTRRSAPLPFLDRLRARGTTWTHLCAVSSTTTPNLASLFTGLLPVGHGIVEHSRHSLREGVRTVAEILREHGYHTYAEFTGPLIAEVGLDRGFDHYRYRDRSEYLHTGFRPYLEQFLPALQEPWFLCLHFWEAHMPYQNPPPFDSAAYGLTAYDRALSLLDHQLRALFDAWDPARTCLVYCGDHGERLVEDFALNAAHGGGEQAVLTAFQTLGAASGGGFDYDAWFALARELFGEVTARIYAHNVLGHGFHLTEELVRVPLVIMDGDRCRPGAVRRDLASQPDLGATLLDLAGVPPAAGLPQGRSLLAGLGADTVYIEANGSGGRQYPARCYLHGARTSRWKYWRLEAPGLTHCVLWDLAQDPRETRDVLAEHPQLAARLDRFVDASLAASAGAAESAGAVRCAAAIDGAPEAAEAGARAARIEQKMRELGYL